MICQKRKEIMQKKKSVDRIEQTRIFHKYIKTFTHLRIDLNIKKKL